MARGRIQIPVVRPRAVDQDQGFFVSHEQQTWDTNSAGKTTLLKLPKPKQSLKGQYTLAKTLDSIIIDQQRGLLRTRQTQFRDVLSRRGGQFKNTHFRFLLKDFSVQIQSSPIRFCEAANAPRLLLAPRISNYLIFLRPNNLNMSRTRSTCSITKLLRRRGLLIVRWPHVLRSRAPRSGWIGRRSTSSPAAVRNSAAAARTARPCKRARPSPRHQTQTLNILPRTAWERPKPSAIFPDYAQNPKQICRAAKPKL